MQSVVFVTFSLSSTQFCALCAVDVHALVLSLPSD